MKILSDDAYESVAAEYQYQLIALLDNVLKKYEVPVEKRQEVCGEFAFDLGMLHDQGEIRSDGIEYEPMVAFNDGETLLIKTDFFEFHEYAFGNTSEYFESDGV